MNDTENGWYLGLERDIDAAIDRAVSTAAPGRIIYYGSSMGGTAALATGLRRRDGTVHAFGAELRPGRPGSQSARYGVPPDDSRFPDFSGFDAPTADGNFHLYYGLFDGTDAANAAYAAQHMPQASLHGLSSSHAAHDHLYSLNVIRRLITTFNRDPAVELAAKHLVYPGGMTDAAMFGAAQEAFSAGDHVPPGRLAAAPGFARNPGIRLLHAEALGRAGDQAGMIVALGNLDHAIETHDIWGKLPKRWRKQIPLRRVEALVALGRCSEAREALAQTCKRFPVDENMRKLSQALDLALGDVPGPIDPPC
ncbi:hypothetical protein GCM10011316_36150 [Roseibium aquae]|uniref:Uncharacterized protein n=1 Tax=Roseibium aquae TaxID=1323746 RepID=A0A916TNS0_9HYPH|nr:hypothetical protein GCM10011316_36150 [Roseibium aquae]